MAPHAEYIIEFLDPYGVPLHRFVDVIEFVYNREDRKVGEATIYLPARYSDKLKMVLPPLHRPTAFVRHCQFKIWRSVDGAPHHLEPATVWLCMKPGSMVTKEGEVFVKLELKDWLWVLKTRQTIYPTGTPQAKYDLVAGDDVVKGWFRDQFTTQLYNPTGRDLQAGGYLTFEPTIAGAPQISQESSSEELFTTMIDACARTYEKGKWMTFDLFSSTGAFPWALGTRFDQLGTDRTPGAHPNPVVLSPWQLDTRDYYFYADYSEEHTVVYGLGPGTGTARLTTSVQDAARVAGSPWGWLETSEQARQGDTINQVSDAAAGRLKMGEPLPVIVIGIEDSDRYKYGRDFFYGDRIAVDFGTERTAFRMVGIQVSVKDGKQLRKFALEYVIP